VEKVSGGVMKVGYVSWNWTYPVNGVKYETTLLSGLM